MVPVMRCLLMAALACAVTGVSIETAEVVALDKLQTPEERYKNVEEGSLAGKADPGYGPASHGRTQLQRNHEEADAGRNKAIMQLQKRGKPVPLSMYDELEPGTPKEAQQLQRSILARIDERTAAKNRGAAPDNIEVINQKAEEISDRIQQAKREIKTDIKQKAKEAKHKQDYETKMKSVPKKERIRLEAVRAEEDALRVKELKSNLQSDGTGIGDDGKPIMVHKSKNWVQQDADKAGNKFAPANGKYREPFVPSQAAAAPAPVAAAPAPRK